ncbi:MAG: ABC transporter permease [Acidimicrobiales bacterium]
MALWSSAQSDVFLSTFNISNVLTQVTPLLVVAAGQTFVVASGGLDLSVGATVSLASVIAATSFDTHTVPVTLVMVLAVALTIGAVNGIAVSAGLNPFLVTLASLSIVQGLAFTVLDTPGGHVPDGFGEIAGYWGPAPVALPLITVLAALASLVLHRTKTGTHIVAVGGDIEVARVSGVLITRSQIWPYVLSALGAAIAGLFIVARIRAGSPTIGDSFTLDSLAAVVLGGSMLGGGRATMFGSVVGALSLGLLANSLNLLGISSFYQTPVKGLVLIIAVLVPNALGLLVDRQRRIHAAHRAT